MPPSELPGQRVCSNECRRYLIEVPIDAALLAKADNIPTRLGPALQNRNLVSGTGQFGVPGCWGGSSKTQFL